MILKLNIIEIKLPMRCYELNCLTKVDSNEEVKQILENIVKLIKEEGGEVMKTILPKKKVSTFFAKGEDEAYLVVAMFYFSPEKIENLIKRIKGEKRILRYLILTKKHLKKTEETINQEIEKVEKEIESVSKEEKIIKKEKTRIEDIDKKLEEILAEEQ